MSTTAEPRLPLNYRKWVASFDLHNQKPSFPLSDNWKFRIILIGRRCVWRGFNSHDWSNLKSSSRSHNRLPEILSQTSGFPPLIVGARTFIQAWNPMRTNDITSHKLMSRAVWNSILSYYRSAVWPCCLRDQWGIESSVAVGRIGYNEFTKYVI
jgi:hypothetical protein